MWYIPLIVILSALSHSHSVFASWTENFKADIRCACTRELLLTYVMQGWYLEQDPYIVFHASRATGCPRKGPQVVDGTM